MFIIYSLPGAFPVLQKKKKKKNNFKYISWHNFSANQKLSCLRNFLTAFLLNTTEGSPSLFHLSSSLFNPIRLWVRGDKCLCISMQRLVFPIWAQLLHRPITLWKLKLSERSQRQRIPSWPCLLNVTRLMCAVYMAQRHFATYHLLR